MKGLEVDCAVAPMLNLIQKGSVVLLSLSILVWYCNPIDAWRATATKWAVAGSWWHREYDVQRERLEVARDRPSICWHEWVRNERLEQSGNRTCSSCHLAQDPKSETQEKGAEAFQSKNDWRVNFFIKRSGHRAQCKHIRVVVDRWKRRETTTKQDTEQTNQSADDCRAADSGIPEAHRTEWQAT